MFPLSFYAGIGLAVGLLLVGHWFPWPRPLPRLWRYIYGVSSILAGIAAWLLVSGQYIVMVGITVIACAGGLAVIISYQIDHIVRLMRMGWRAERMIDDGDA
ncbi:MAG: hypothetical protein GWN58_19525 [Anaerolineae bacterium]|nr:hypothetical protein [Anaerolineae bacterium]